MPAAQSRSSSPRRRLARLLAAAVVVLAVAMPASAASPLSPPPPTSFKVTSAAQKSIAVSWSASSDPTVRGYGLYRDGVLVGSTTTQTTYTFTGLQCGTSYTLGVDAVNLLGFRSDVVPVSAATPACADTTPPSTPTGLAATPAQQSVALSWTASDDNVGVAGYGVYQGSTRVTQTPGTSYSVTGLACGTAYSFSVDAYDAAGNRSGKATATVTTIACASDTTPPSTPTGLAATPAQQSVALSWTASNDNVGVAGYGVYQGSTRVTQTPGTSYSVTGLACGTAYSFSVDAYDAAGNRSGKATVSATTTSCPPPSGGLHVSGNQLLDANNNPVQLHGVNYSGAEYACIQGWGIFDGPSDDAMVTAIRSWNSNVVRLGMNEDCVLGINGVKAAYAGSNYMNAIVSYVNKLHAHGMYAEITLMWAAPGSQQATDQPPILDQDHSAAALRVIANAFKADPMTFLGLMGEPHDITWQCWRDGGSACNVGYSALGMQAALDAVRQTGATNVVTVSGIDYANNLSQWLTYRPTDSLGQLIAEAHVYGGNTCMTTSCFNTNYAPVAQSVPLIFGETGQTYDDSSCGSNNVNTFMTWADAHNVGYQAWTWDTWGTCGSLISDFDGTPANAYGTWVRDHLRTRP
jgi:endoglucanase